MTVLRKTLVMAGSREAHGIISGLLGRGRHVIASLPEAERSFDPLPVPTRMGPFASHKVFADWLEAENVSTVMDASHVFDAALAKLVRDVCRHMRLRHLRVLRPVWRETPQDNWTHVKDVQRAAVAIPRHARVFTNTGYLTLADYAAFQGARLYMRQNHAVQEAPPYDFMQFLVGEPPYSQTDEERLFRQLDITHLICRNVGGAASMSKILAARKLELSVLMVARPPILPNVTVVETVAEALAWEVDGPA